MAHLRRKEAAATALRVPEALDEGRRDLRQPRLHRAVHPGLGHQAEQAAELLGLIPVIKLIFVEQER